MAPYQKKCQQTSRSLQVGRRAFLKSGSLVLLAGTLNPSKLFAAEPQTALRVGLVTDLHYADKPPRGGTRHYRETLQKLKEAPPTTRTPS